MITGELRAVEIEADFLRPVDQPALREPVRLGTHDGVEFIYMLMGKVIYRHADKLYPMSAGDALFFDSGAPHGPEELLERPMKYLSIIIYPRA